MDTEETIKTEQMETLKTSEINNNKEVKDSEKKECPFCKNMISSKPGPYSMHIKKCAQTQEDKFRAKVLGLENVPVKVDISDDKKAVVDAAIAKQKELLDSPEIILSESNADQHLKIIEQYAPEAKKRYDEKGRPLHTHTAYFADHRIMNSEIAKGFVPKLDGRGQYVTDDGGEILCTRPREITEAINRRNEYESEMRITSVTKLASFDSTLKGAELPSEGEIKEFQFGPVGTLTVGLNEI